MSGLFDTVYRNMERLHAEGKMSRHPSEYVQKIRPQIRNTSRQLQPLSSTPVRALVDFVNESYRDKNCRGGGKHFKAGSTVYLRRATNGFLHIMPFELAGQGFEMCKDAVEGKHFEFI